MGEKFYIEILHARHALITEGGLDSIRTANGSSVRGTVTFPLILGHNSYSCSASVVVGLSYDIVIGRDFLHEFSAVIAVRGENVTFKGCTTVPFALANTSPVVTNVNVTAFYDS